MSDHICRTKRKGRAILVLVCMSILLLLTGGNAYAAKKKRILLVGNSLLNPYNNSTIDYLEELGKAGGYKFKIDYVAHNGEKMKHYADPAHSRGKEFRKTVRSAKWQYVVLQEHTDWAIAHRSTMKAAIAKVAKYIRKKCPEARLMLNATWAYHKTRHHRGKDYSYKLQQQLINQSYEETAEQVEAEIIYSGNAFRRYMKTKGHVDLYKRDKNHPSAAGAYMDACCIYAKITGKTPYKNPYCGPLSKKKARKIQKIAAEVILG